MADRTRGDAAEDVGASGLEHLAGLAGITLPGVGTASQWMARKIREEWARNRSTALRAAERTSGLSREDLAEQVAADPRLVPLVTRLLYAAGMNGHDNTLRAMGAAFGDAVRDREAVDECEIILGALADLTEAHSIVLLTLSEKPLDPPPDLPHWVPYLLEERSGLPPRTTSLCVAALVARGLVVAPTGFGGEIVYHVTPLGRDVLAVLREHAEAGG
ncbi:hypothetical protein [Geodermatophilus chilensis]|uniref:hypothetical protein n=1 Tax=Geodermatophilus chilensis TaxID=2035835 RepID=UPI000C268731|nr:hypothetical protein [Geodermatophilus chilensis]